MRRSVVLTLRARRNVGTYLAEIRVRGIEGVRCYITTTAYKPPKPITTICNLQQQGKLGIRRSGPGQHTTVSLSRSHTQISGDNFTSAGYKYGAGSALSEIDEQRHHQKDMLVGDDLSQIKVGEACQHLRQYLPTQLMHRIHTEPPRTRRSRCQGYPAQSGAGIL